MEKTKECFKCGETKPLVDFYKHAGMADGHLGKCRKCARVDAVERRKKLEQDPVWVAKETKRVREKARRMRKGPYGKIVTHAHNQTRSLKVEGKELHHWSYQEEHLKDVVMLTRKDHRKIHRYIKMDEFHLQFRTLRGVLLDTREAAEAEYKRILTEEED